MSLIFQTIDAARGAAGGKTTLDQSEANKWAREGEAVYYRHYHEQLLSTVGPIKENATGCALEEDEIRELFPAARPTIDQIHGRRRRIALEIAERMMAAACTILPYDTFARLLGDAPRERVVNLAAWLAEFVDNDDLADYERRATRKATARPAPHRPLSTAAAANPTGGHDERKDEK